MNLYKNFIGNLKLSTKLPTPNTLVLIVTFTSIFLFIISFNIVSAEQSTVFTQVSSGNQNTTSGSVFSGTPNSASTNFTNPFSQVSGQGSYQSQTPFSETTTNSSPFSLVGSEQAFSIPSAPSTQNTTPQSPDIGQMICKGAACVNVSFSCPLSLIFTRNTKIGDTGIDIVSLQKYLEKSRFLVIPSSTVYGYFGSKTSAALSSFQASVGVPATGALDDKTRALLNARVFNRTECFSYVKYDALYLSLASKANKTSVASDLNFLRMTADGTKKFCTKPTNSSDACFNISNTSSFIAYMPSKVSSVKSAIYLATLTKSFSKVAYIPSEPNAAIGSIVTLLKTPYVTSYSTTTVSNPNR